MHYFGTILIEFFFNRRTQMISIDILVPGPSVNNCSIMAENGKNSPHGRRVYKM